MLLCAVMFFYVLSAKITCSSLYWEFLLCAVIGFYHEGLRGDFFDVSFLALFQLL